MEDFSVGDATQNAIEIETENTIDEEVEEEVNESISKYVQHGEKVKAVEKQLGKNQYIINLFIGPGSGTYLGKLHPKKCPELLPLSIKPKPFPDFFCKDKMKVPFHEDIAVAKLLKWIVKTDQSFTTVDNEHFQDYANDLKSDISIPSRRTIMRRLEEMYTQNKEELKAKLKGFKSKYSTFFLWLYYPLY